MSSNRNQSLPVKTYNKVRKDGFLSLVTAIPRYVYSHYIRSYVLTHTTNITYNGVESPERQRVSVLDRIIPKYTRHNPGYESAEIDAIRTYCREGDKVVIIGAGRGITPTIAANSVGEEDEILAYEASADRISQARRTVHHNNLSEQVSIEHKIVAKAEDVAGDMGSASTLSPDRLPDCDYLEIDCEGAEELILEEMSMSPRIISVETHETKGVSHKKVVELLKNHGYEIVEKTDKTDQVEGIRHLVAKLKAE
jgi:hypothetical protein